MHDVVEPLFFQQLVDLRAASTASEGYSRVSGQRSTALWGCSHVPPVGQKRSYVSPGGRKPLESESKEWEKPRCMEISWFWWPSGRAPYVSGWVIQPPTESFRFMKTETGCRITTKQHETEPGHSSVIVAVPGQTHHPAVSVRRAHLTAESKRVDIINSCPNKEGQDSLHHRRERAGTGLHLHQHKHKTTEARAPMLYPA